ncbi:hypothetical protein TYRP_007909 [Tyrophagus putrescentiae]|nr:hypothetical protein TYRP_007909 [Tyrophagus putrescentiae]
MLFFVLLGWLGLLVLMCFFILSIAAGLYYLAELVEEFTVTSAKVIRCLNWFVIGVYVCLFLFENLPNYLIIIGLASHLNHIFILKSFPFFKLTSLSFIGFIVLLIANHYLTFSYFANVYAHFTQSFFVSLGANDNVLPSYILSSDDSDLISHYFSRKGKRSGLLSFFNFAKESILPERVKKPY